MHVRFQLHRASGRGGPPTDGLHFTHNGRGFTALDVLGLASVGLSTKSKAERTIGFMGVGFKAVYKRFARVTVYDSTWVFRFEEPATPPPMEPTQSWVLKPRWAGVEGSAGDLWDGQPASATAAWCHFQLERPRGGTCFCCPPAANVHLRMT